MEIEEEQHEEKSFKRLPAIFGIEGRTLRDDEKKFFKDIVPWGFILFKRNIESHEQVRALVDSLHQTLGRRVPVMIDQEGGRVSRLPFDKYPAAEMFGRLYAQDPEKATRACTLNARLMGIELRDLGILINTVPVLDLKVDGAHEIISDRAYSDDQAIVTELGFCAMDGLLSARVLPVMKHIPGHGRARADSHVSLPIVDDPLYILEKDFWPFLKLSGAPLAMAAHVVYNAVDPHLPASLSPDVIENIIRDFIGFDGLLVSDDISMKALDSFGSVDICAQQALNAGCDLVLHCNADMIEMKSIARKLGNMRERAMQRTVNALSFIDKPILVYNINNIKKEFNCIMN